jgi:hypothetical protein
VSPVPTLAGFAAALALVFGTAAFAGSRIDVRPGEPAAGAVGAAAGMGGMGGASGEAAGDAASQQVRGLAVSDRGLTLELRRTTAPQGRPFALAFRVADRRGRTVRAFAVEHTKRMHLVVVRRDMTGFQHLHPTQARDGSWSTTARLPAAGSYRVFADFSAGGTPRTLAADLAVDGATRSRALPPPAATTTVDGLDVTLRDATTRAGAETDLRFDVRRAGRPVVTRPYLGARGHLVALRAGDLAFLHVHPDADRLRFMATLPTAGTYRLFLQFETADGRLHTAAFTREVTR